jgi:RNA polymerase sigma-70 factor (ECF subfamily)
MKATGLIDAGIKPTPKGDISTPQTAEQIYHDYASRVYHMARRMVRNEMDAEDVTQDVLLQVVRKLPTFRGDAAFPTWLHRVTVNTALSHRRKQAVRREYGLDAPLDDQPQGGANAPDGPLMDDETRRLIEQAIADLPEQYHDVFVFADLQNLPNATIGAMLGLSVAAVKSRLHRARQLLRAALAPHFQELAVLFDPLKG